LISVFRALLGILAVRPSNLVAAAAIAIVLNGLSVAVAIIIWGAALAQAIIIGKRSATNSSQRYDRDQQRDCQKAEFPSHSITTFPLY
jgi:hypothetical protein